RTGAGHTGYGARTVFPRSDQSARRLSVSSALQACDAAVQAATARAANTRSGGRCLSPLSVVFATRNCRCLRTQCAALQPLSRKIIVSREQAIANAEQCFDSGAFRAVLSRRVSIPTESQNP